MIFLSIETSCDETAIALIESNGDAATPSFRLLGNALYSQAKTHAEYGGVFPMLAKREHAKNIIPLLTSALEISTQDGLQHISDKADISQEKINNILKILERETEISEIFVNFISNTPVPKIDAICVTQGPGLEPALWVGISFAKALATAWNVPIIPVNHMEGHIVSVLMGSNSITEEPAIDQEKQDAAQILSNVTFPALALLISGGHTELVLIKNWHEYEVIGQTRDDAVGEAFDKAARILGLPYPGGPEISKLAAARRASQAVQTTAGTQTQEARPYTLPRPMIHTNDLDFSFSGIKTAVLYLVRDLKTAKQPSFVGQTSKKITVPTGGTPQNQIELSPDTISAIAEEFENAVTEVLISKTKKALEQTGAQTLIIGGGVVANTFIRQNFEKLLASEFSGMPLFVPSVDMSTDNAVMIGIAGALRYHANPQAALSPDQADFRAQGNLQL